MVYEEDVFRSFITQTLFVGFKLKYQKVRVCIVQSNLFSYKTSSILYSIYLR